MGIRKVAANFNICCLFGRTEGVWVKIGVGLGLFGVGYLYPRINLHTKRDSKFVVSTKKC